MGKASYCKSCAPGTYADQTSLPQCKGCASGKYNPSYGRKIACTPCTDTGSCSSGKVKLGNKSCMSTQNQECVTKWDSWLGSTKCSYQGAAEPCGSAESK